MLAVIRLNLSDFRSYTHGQIETDGRPITLTGPNGAGKTNLLEAISFLAPGRGLRAARLSEVARNGSHGRWAISARLHIGEDEVQVGTGRQVGGVDEEIDRRLVRIDGQDVSGPSALARYVSLVWLTPVMDRLFLEGASGRRRFFDRLVLSFDPDHAARSNAYDRAMRERNALLKRGSRDAAWFSAIEARMAEEGVALAAARRDTLGRLVAQMKDTGKGVTRSGFPVADLALEGELEQQLDTLAAVDVEDWFARQLAGHRERDREAGRALQGPHRSDLTVRFRAKDCDARTCSTGEQKALLIGIVLAHARARTMREGGEPPLLLLDEVAAHLDRDRRSALFDEICALGAQAWMTGTDQSLFEGLGSRAQHYDVRDGKILPLAD